MEIQLLIAEIKDGLTKNFADLDSYFLINDEQIEYQPEIGGWSIHQILEHVGLTNHFLLILIEKGTRRALNVAEKESLDDALKDYSFHRTQLEEVGQHKSFQWIRPEHMEPKGEKSLPEIRRQLQDQLAQCQAVLHRLPNGEGILAKTTMTVNDLGKLDVYEYIYFLSQHAKRHVQQIEKVELEFKKVNN
jgi:hypothetical protein